MKSESLAGFWVFVLWTLLLILFTAITGYNGLYGQDSHEYLRYCSRLINFFMNGESPGDYFWPVNYPLMGAAMAFITGPQAGLQLVSILSAAWILYFVCMFLFLEFPGREREVIFYVIIFLGLSPYFFRYGISAMSDLPAIAFALSAYYGLFRYHIHKHNNWLYAVIPLAVMSVFTRFACMPLVTPAVLLSIFWIFKKFDWLRFAGSVISSLIPVFIHFYFKEENPDLIFRHYLVSDWSVANYIKNSFDTLDGRSEYLLPNIVVVLAFLIHPGFFFPGLIFLYLLIFKKGYPSLKYPVVIAGMILYLLFIAGIPSRNMRYLLPVLPLYVAICFPVFLVVVSWLYHLGNRRMLVLYSTLIVQLILVILAFKPFYLLNRLERSIALKVVDHHPRLLYTFGMDGAVRSYGYKGEIVNLWEQPLDSVSSESMLLFNREKSWQQWNGRNPMINFNLIIKNCRSVMIEKFESGWELYEIQKAYPDPHTGFSEGK